VCHAVTSVVRWPAVGFFGLLAVRPSSSTRASGVTSSIVFS
jgi:hypothetical protein